MSDSASWEQSCEHYVVDEVHRDDPLIEQFGFKPIVRVHRAGASGYRAIPSSFALGGTAWHRLSLMF